MAATAAAEPGPQADRRNIGPLLNDVEQIRLDLTQAANWLFGHWPADLKAPQWAPTRADYGSLHLTTYQPTPAELLTARRALEQDGAEVTMRRSEHRDGSVYVGVVRSFGSGTVALEAFTTLAIWEQAYPSEVPA